MTYVKSISEVERNAFALLDAVYGYGADHDIAVKMVKGGRVFYPIQYQDALAFVPSKFIGYRNNSVREHDAVKRDEGRDGRATNEAIRKILGKPLPDEELERRLVEYCRSLGTEIESHKHSFWRVEAAKRFTAPTGSAINDIQSADMENDDPEYKLRTAGTYIRDAKVRKAVLKRAKGSCEYGSSGSIDAGCATFLKQDGKPYLESHHIIKLSEQGRDKESNVIALCANHHREAHFGKNWQALQEVFLRVISKKLGD